MARSGLAALSLCLAIVTGISSAQTATPAKVDFGRDVLPIFREQCGDCHGPAKQRAGMRLDRRSSVMKSFSRRVVPGSSSNSFVYYRLIGRIWRRRCHPPARFAPNRSPPSKPGSIRGPNGPTPSPTKPICHPSIPRQSPWSMSLRSCRPAVFLKSRHRRSRPAQRPRTRRLHALHVRRALHQCADIDAPC